MIEKRDLRHLIANVNLHKSHKKHFYASSYRLGVYCMYIANLFHKFTGPATYEYERIHIHIHAYIHTAKDRGYDYMQNLQSTSDKADLPNKRIQDAKN